MGESNILGVSFRCVIALAVIGTVCIMAYVGKKVDEPLYSLVLIISGAYFGKSSSPVNNNVNGSSGVEKKKDEQPSPKV